MEQRHALQLGNPSTCTRREINSPETLGDIHVSRGFRHPNRKYIYVSIVGGPLPSCPPTEAEEDGENGDA